MLLLVTVSLRKHPFLLALRRRVLSDEERGETDVFAGYVTVSEDIFNLLVVRARRPFRLQPGPHGAFPKSDQHQQKRL